MDSMGLVVGLTWDSWVGSVMAWMNRSADQRLGVSSDVVDG